MASDVALTVCTKVIASTGINRKMTRQCERFFFCNKTQLISFILHSIRGETTFICTCTYDWIIL